jgi:hypothetical protein
MALGRRSTMNDENRARYEQYLQSPQWQAIREQRLAEAGYRCEFNTCDGDEDWLMDQDEGGRCPVTSNLEVHHLTYDNLGRERTGDLKVLCPWHHALEHAMTAICWRCRELLFDSDFDVLDYFGEDFAEITAETIVRDFTDCGDAGKYCEIDRKAAK